MKPQGDCKFVLVTRKTRLQNLIVRFNTVQQAQFYVEHLGADFSDYLHEDSAYHTAVGRVQETLGTYGRVQLVDREFLPNFLFGRDDIVVAVGQDGLVANTLKYLTDQPLIGVNPDPSRWDGVLLPFVPGELPALLPEVMSGRRPVKEITLAQAALNDGQVLCGVNDLFIGQKTHISARYQILLGSESEQQSSSGIIVSTGLGSTGWLKSIVTGAASIMNAASRNPMKTGNVGGFDWGADYLYYTVREPYPSKTTAAGLVFGKIPAGTELTIISQMPENGVIFSDGLEQDFLQFNSGIEAKIGIAKRKGHLVQ